MNLRECLLVAFPSTLLLSQGCSSTDLTITHPVPDAACSDGNGDRFADCGNGTVTDTTTGLIWLKDASCLGERNWKAATTAVALLRSGPCGLTDNSSPGQWRLPTKNEWEAVLEPSCVQLPSSPALPDAAGTGCYASGTPWASGVPSVPAEFWSSTIYADDPLFSWDADLYDGRTFIKPKIGPLLAWPVRSGP